MTMTQMPVVMTPHVATPQMFQQAMPPWVTQTPESSPMPWGRAPPGEYLKPFPFNLDPTMPNGISKEFLRSVCEPFFDEMLVAVYQAVQAQTQQALHTEGQRQSVECQGFHGQCHSIHGRSTSFGSLPCAEPSSAPSTEDSSDVSDCGAFSSIFTPVPNEGDHFKTGHQSIMSSVDALSKVTRAVPDDAELRQREVESEVVSEHGSDLEKSVMVCRHWKSKGWCRMEDNCKFLHPEHKRGVGPGFVNCSKAGGMSDGNSADISNGLVHGSNPSHESALTTTDCKKKSKKRRSKGKSVNLRDEAATVPGQVVDVQLAGYAIGGVYVQYGHACGTGVTM
jgi:hypothetical protein